MEHGLKVQWISFVVIQGLQKASHAGSTSSRRSQEHLVNAVQTNSMYGVQMTYANKLSDNQDLRISTLCSLWYKNVLF
jgi:cob(I)alamin adenosyltransferase